MVTSNKEVIIDLQVPGVAADDFLLNFLNFFEVVQTCHRASHPREQFVKGKLCIGVCVCRDCMEDVEGSASLSSAAVIVREHSKRVSLQFLLELFLAFNRHILFQTVFASFFELILRLVWALTD